MQTTQTSKGAGRLASVITLVLAAAELLSAALLILAVRPQFAAQFADMDGELPALTHAVLGVPAAALLVGLLVLVGVLIAKEAVARPPMALAVNVGAMVVGFLAVAALVAAMFLPMIALLDALQQ